MKDGKHEKRFNCTLKKCSHNSTIMICNNFILEYKKARRKQEENIYISFSSNGNVKWTTRYHNFHGHCTFVCLKRRDKSKIAYTLFDGRSEQNHNSAFYFRGQAITTIIINHSRPILRLTQCTHIIRDTPTVFEDLSRIIVTKIYKKF